MTGKQMETRLERVCVPSAGEEGCGHCSNCHYGKLSEQFAAIAHDFWRAAQQDTGPATRNEIVQHWKHILILYRELTPAQEKHIAKVP